MASTRNINTSGDYCLQQSVFERHVDYNLYQHSQFGSSHRPAIPNKCIGVPSFSMNERSVNGIDIESELKGIGSTNLVKPRSNFVPNPHILPNICFFDSNATILPKPLIIEKDQRFGKY